MSEMIKIPIGTRAKAREWLDTYQPAYLKDYGWHFTQFYGYTRDYDFYAIKHSSKLMPKPESSHSEEVNTKYGYIPVCDEEMVTYVGGGIWDVR